MWSLDYYFQFLHSSLTHLVPKMFGFHCDVTATPLVGLRDRYVVLHILFFSLCCGIWL